MRTELICSEFLMASGFIFEVQDKMVEKIMPNIAEHSRAALHSA